MTSDAAYTANQYFNDEKSRMYDEKIRKSIPGYMALHEMVFDFLSQALPEKAHILIAGAGTGTELRYLGTRKPGWYFTAFDISPEMIALCENSLKHSCVAERVTLIEGRVDQVPDSESFDAATSLLVSHFIRGSELRQAYFSKIARHLKPKAHFLAADLMGDERHPAYETFFSAWKKHNINNGRTPEEFEADLAVSRKVVEFISEKHYCDLLEHAGFSHVKEFYRAFHFSGWFCRRNGG